MLTLLEVFAFMATAGFAVFAFRRYLKRGSAVVVMFASLGLLFVAATPASATDYRTGDSITIGRDEKIKGDLIITGQRVRVEGDVDGDLIVFSEDAEIQGHVTGDVLGGMQSLRIDGPVDGNVRVAANNVTLNNKVGRNVMVWAQHFSVAPSGQVGRSATVFCQILTIDGHVGGDILAFDQVTSISGTVGGNVRARGERLSIENTAVIEGKVKFEGHKPPEVASGAKLTSAVEFKEFEHRSRMERGGGYYVWRVIWASAFILFGLVLLWVLPQFSREAVANVENVGASFGLGVLVGFALPIAAILACVTVVGLFVGLSALSLWLASLFFSQIVVGTAVGWWILGRTNETWPLVGRMAIGVLILRAGIALPYIGGWIKIAVILWGIGAISLATYRRLQPVMTPNIPSVPLGQVGTPLPPNTTVSGL